MWRLLGWLKISGGLWRFMVGGNGVQRFSGRWWHKAKIAMALGVLPALFYKIRIIGLAGKLPLAQFFALLLAKNVTTAVWSAKYYNNVFCKIANKRATYPNAMQFLFCATNKTNIYPERVGN